ncbi:MAG TPA: glycine--tRNA ligase subunit beta, partial [Candidatus Eisenbacteria bacterium]
DPYALRRAANGIMRILMEKQWHLDLDATVAAALSTLPPTAFAKGAAPDAVKIRINDFLRDRLDYFLREAGLPYDVVAATLAPVTTMSKGPVDARARANALAAIRGEADLEKLVVGYKRAANILKGVDENPPADASSIEAGEPAEKALWNAWREASDALRGAIDRVDYPAAVRTYLSLRAPIDDFFNGVMVNSENAAEKRRRLGLLGQVRELFDRLYDLSKIVVEG